ncbi:uncharacterized protein palb2 [Lampris incognitus]|uniref:uncharacterized protein palb2 n=1 Tax=Lampris incognitus TaxID=2546036 RepID=UPI0024B5328F|nr:uncharacterized protein palb2 [Lampris incognitus]
MVLKEVSPRSYAIGTEDGQLRRKLKILQKAYAKTEQRLKRAEHAETVRKHARSGITEQNLQDQSNPGVNSSFSTKPLQPLLNQDTAIRTTPCISQDQCDTEVQDESDNSGRSPAVRFHLPSDAACHLLPETGPNLARGHRSSSALRLRSRQSRLRWEKRWRESAEAVGSTYNSEEGQEQSQAIEGAGEPEMKQVNTAEVDTVSEREELLADSESQSPSLLLTHWNTTGYSEREEREGKERGEQEQIGRETESKEQGRKECKSLSPLLTHWTPTAHSDRPRPKENQNSRGEGTGNEREFERGKEVEYPQEGQRCEMLYEESGGKNFEHELDKKIQKERGDGIREIREEKNGEGLEKTRESHNNRSETMGPLSSSTLVEGLLFPTEYYVRTTRRMIYSQSQSDMQAVTLSQLTGGRQCRSRGRGKKRSSWRSLLLPSPPAPEAQLLPLPLGPAVDRLVLFDLQQDFHLPDDQFASLKLHKLRQTLPALKLDTPVKREGGYEQVEGTDEMSEDCVMRWTHTLKAPAGGGLVDACCFSGPSGGLWVAAAGKWAVCVWDLTSTSEWSLIHTWTFNEPVINVFPIPDAAGLLCVTLGQLEIREVRMLSCSRLLQMLLCEGVVQAVVGVARCRVVSSSHSATVSTLQLFTLSEDSSKPTYEPLVSPGVCVGALAAVDGLSDVLIGSAEGGHLFIWNLRTGQLLKRISFGEGLSNTVCLRGYSDCGVLFVLLQHNLLNSLENEQKKYYKQDETVSMEVKEREGKRITLFSLIAANPLNGKSTLATQLFEPEAWSSRLCDADVQGTSVVGLSQSGSVFVWELEGQGGSRVVWASETEGWQLARWGSGDTLVTGHHNGDLSLYRYTVNRTALNHSTPKRL